MKRFAFWIFLGLTMLAFLAFSCSDDLKASKDCTTLATVRDLTGLDGCGYVFELADGTHLIPVRMLFCGTPPLPKEVTEDPLYNFSFVDGKKVKIGYERSHEQANVCMAGTMVKITCLEEVVIRE